MAGPSRVRQKYIYIKFTPFWPLNLYQLAIKCARPQAYLIKFKLNCKKEVSLYLKCAKGCPINYSCKQVNGQPSAQLTQRLTIDLFATVISWAAFCIFKYIKCHPCLPLKNFPFGNNMWKAAGQAHFIQLEKSLTEKGYNYQLN